MWFVWGYTIVSQLLSWGQVFFQSFPLPFPLLKYVSSIFSTVSLIYNSQKCLVSQNIWCLIKTQLKNITQTIFQGGSPWATQIHNSVVCLGVHYCVQLLPEVMFFFQAFPFPFPLLKCVSFHLASFFLESEPKTFQRISFIQPKQTHEWSWYTIVWFVWGYTIVSQLLSWGQVFFQSFPLPFPLLKYCSFIFSIVSFF